MGALGLGRGAGGEGLGREGGLAEEGVWAVDVVAAFVLHGGGGDEGGYSRGRCVDG